MSGASAQGFGKDRKRSRRASGTYELSHYPPLKESRPRDCKGPGFLGYRLWKSEMASDAFWRLWAGSHVSSEMSYPFQWTRYWSWRRRRRESLMVSTSYSSCPSMRSGEGGGAVCCDGKRGGLKGRRRDSWKVPWRLPVDPGRRSL